MGIGPEVWFPIVTLVIGVALKAAFDFFTEQRTASREQAKIKEQRQTAWKLRKVELQHNSALELQEEIFKLSRATGTINFNDTINYSKTGLWNQVLEENHIPSEDVSRSIARIHLLRVRIGDENVSMISKKFVSLCARSSLSESKESSDLILSQATDVQIELNEKIGELINRDIYGDD